MRNGRAKGIEQRAEGKIIGTRRKAQGARQRERAGQKGIRFRV